MKNYNDSFAKKNFGALLLYVSFLTVIPDATAQPALTPGDRIFRELPANLPLPAQPQHYHITTDYFNRTMAGVFMDKIRITGDFTTNLPQKMEKWNNVSIAKSQQLHGDFGKPEPVLYIENFTYEPSEKILQPEFFKDFPFEAVQIKNLVWDMAGIEAFAWGHTDSLKLNRLYQAKQMNGPANLAGLGTFTNNNIELTWEGISLINDQLCGLIDFRTMDNPLVCDIEMGGKNLNIKGTSHYWGTIYISLSEKKIEDAQLHEIVTMEMKWSDQPATQYVYTTRLMKVEKIN